MDALQADTTLNAAQGLPSNPSSTVWLQAPGSLRDGDGFDLGFFASEGVRLMSIEMLLHTVRAIIKNPDSNESHDEYAWLEGKGRSAVVCASDCFDFIAEGGVDLDRATDAFLEALRTDPVALEDALLITRTRLRSGDYECPQFMEDKALPKFASPRFSA